MSQVRLFQDNNYLGREITLTDSQPNFLNINFNDQLSSLIVDAGTWTLYEGDTIYVEIELNVACSGNDNKGNLYTQSNRGALVYADCFTSATGIYTSPTYTVVGGDLGSTITLDAYANCSVMCN